MPPHRGRHHHSNNGTSNIVDCVSADIGCSNISGIVVPVVGLPATTHVFSVTFSGSTELASGDTTGDMDLTVHKDNWGNWNETNDYSWADTTTLIAAPMTGLYRNNVLVWGLEPGMTGPPPAYLCGDGEVQSGETCDPGEGPGAETASCDRDCTAAECGDSVLNRTAGEVCEPSLMSGCKEDCSGYEEGGPTPPTACTDPNACLHARHSITDSYTDNAIRPMFMIVNNSGETVPLGELTLRYWFTSEPTGSTFTTWCDWAALQGYDNQCSLVTRSIVEQYPTAGGAEYYYQLGFNTTITLAPGASTNEIKVRASETSTWGNFDEYNDYSNTKSGSYTATDKIVIYRDGELVWGEEP